MYMYALQRECGKMLVMLVGHVLTTNKKEISKVKRDCALGRIEDPRVN